MYKIITSIFLLFTTLSFFGQQLVHSSILHGGITGNGVSAANGSGTINFATQIFPNSTIKKALLLAARDSLADDITVNLNGINYLFRDATIITKDFNSFNGAGLNRPNSSIHFIDITADIDSSINNYTLSIPPPTNISKGVYTFYYLYIVYENLLLPKISCNLFLNTQDVAPITNYNFNNITPISNTKPIALAINALQFCDTTQDGSYISINSNTIGLIGGADLNSNLWSCVGPWSNFAHYNDSLFELDDDTPDSLMAATDALADIKSYVNNGDTSVDVTFTYQTPSWQNGRLTNPIRAVMLSYSTPCDTFSTSISTVNDTICPWGSTQLQATGGSKYSWFGAFGGLNDSSIANPIASPPQTTTYICTITNDSGCVKTDQVKIWVDPCVGIDENNNNAPLIELYPNPTNGSFTITSNKTIENITINNIIGATVYQQSNIANNSLNLNLNLPNALYFISIKTANGSVVKKLVVK